MLRDGEVASPAAFWKETPALSRGFLLSWERLLRPEGLGALLWELMESGPVWRQWRECVTYQLFGQVGVHSQSVDSSNDSQQNWRNGLLLRGAERERERERERGRGRGREREREGEGERKGVED